MFKNLTIRKKLIYSIVVGILIPFMIGGYYLENLAKDWLYSNNFEVNERILDQVAELVDYSLVLNIKEKVQMLSEETVVKNAKERLSDYTSFDPNAAKYEVSKEESDIKNTFEVIKKSNSVINFIFYGTEDGGYVEFPTFNPKGSYDPRIRPWYENTIREDSLIISDPYMTDVTKDLVISMTIPVENGESKVGVIGASVRIDDITESIEDIEIGDTGYLIIMNERNKIVVSPKNPDWLLKTPTELGLDSLMDLSGNNDSFIERNINGIDSILNVVVSDQSGWKMISVIDKSELLKDSRIVRGFFIVFYLATILVSVIVIYNISIRITNPIMYISNAISDMAKFNFKLKDNETITSYSEKKDEIGIISNSLIEMNSNFVELIDQVEVLNDEIKNIDIENRSHHGVSLSKSNPFHIVVDSMNILLDKVNLYLDKLKQSNVEVVNKNDLLVATEEELRAQISEIDEQKRYINFLAYHNPLTQLPNRRKFVEHYNATINHENKCAVVLLDLDNFKGINDTMGHIYGDKVLIKVAERLNDFIESNTFISRFGGDEFLILIECTKGDENFETLIKQLYHLFDKAIEVEGSSIEITYSMGVSLYPKDSEDVDKLIMYSDLALYSVKNETKSGYRFFDEKMLEKLLLKADIENILKDAIDSDGFKIVYQPIINTETGISDSYEALLRLKSHNISPAEFIPISEKNGQITKIGRLVVMKVISQLSEWKKLDFELKPIAINFSAIQLHDHSFIDYVKKLCIDYDINPQLLEIEITENVFLDNKELAIDYLTKFRELGIKISIDDFGTGYSSMSYLMSLPVDKIKLDRSLNTKFLELENIQVLDSLISLVHGLKLKVVAEGIEEYEQVRRLKVGKCDYIQGYYFSRPLEAEDVSITMTKKYM